MLMKELEALTEVFHGCNQSPDILAVNIYGGNVCAVKCIPSYIMLSDEAFDRLFPGMDVAYANGIAIVKPGTKGDWINGTH